MKGQKSHVGSLNQTRCLNNFLYECFLILMNYQLLIESYSFGTTPSNQEIELLSLELETQIMNMNISTDFGCFNSAPTHICKGLNLRKGTSWIMCLAEILDIHNPPKIGKTKSVKVYDLLLEKGIVIG